MVIKRYTHQTAKRFWDSQTSSPANSAADWTTWEDWGSGGAVVMVVVMVVVYVCVCVWGGGGG